MRTDWFRFLGMNIKGTPSMRRAAVEADLNVARQKADVLVTQEFKWNWYYSAAKAVLGRGETRWASSPNFNAGFLAPVFGAQSVKWKRDRFKRVRTRRALLHAGVAKVSESRWLRAALLEDRETGLKAWFGSTHFVVGGDEASDSPLRKRMLADNIEALDKFIAKLKRGGHAIFFQLDANIHPGTWAYTEFMRVMRKHGATIHGKHGVEFLFTIDGESVEVEVKRDWIVPTTVLNTDHEGRGVTARLVKKGAK